MHYQAEPHGEAKLVRCTRGAVFDVVVDLRPDSPTFRRWFGVELRAGGTASLFVPAGSRTASRRSRTTSEVHYQMGAPLRARGGARRALGRPGVRHRVAGAAGRRAG